MTKLRLSALAAALALLVFATSTVFGAPLRQVLEGYFLVGAQTTLTLNVRLADGSTVVVPVDLEMTTHILNGVASVDLSAVVGEGANAATTTLIDIPAVIETVPATPIATSAPIGSTANRNANLRQGPGTNYAIVGSVQDGETLQIVGRNTDKTWLQLANGAWIAAFLVDNAPVDPPTVAPTVEATVQPPATATQPPLPTSTPPPPPPPSTPDCDKSYPDEGMCIPPGAADLDCGDVPWRRFTVLQPDPHRFDGDMDGVGCEG